MATPSQHRSRDAKALIEPFNGLNHAIVNSSAETKEQSISAFIAE
jgi:hypothetical protein